MSVSIYLDCCALQRPLDDHGQLRVATEGEAIIKIIGAHEIGSVRLITSFALQFEIDRIRQPKKKAFYLEFLRRIPDFVALNETILHRAKSYETANIKTMDALHLACAVEAEANYFCTCDDALLRKAKEQDTGLTKPVSVLDLVMILL